MRWTLYSVLAAQEVVRDQMTGQWRQPTRLAACLDSTNGLFQALAIYELRSSPGDGLPDDGVENRESLVEDDEDLPCISPRSSTNEEPPTSWHVYINDVLSMRQLLPMMKCWREGVGSMLISLLQQKSEAKHTVVVLKALCEAPGLENYYERIGFSNHDADFELAGLRKYYYDGEMMRR